MPLLKRGFGFEQVCKLSSWLRMVRFLSRFDKRLLNPEFALPPILLLHLCVISLREDSVSI